MITKEIVTGMISILEGGMMQIREDTVVKEDGVELSRTYHRTTLEPGQDVTGYSEKIQNVAAAIWTPEVIDARRIELEKIKASLPIPPPVVES